MVLNLIIISRVIRGRPSYIPIFAKPAAASALMGLGAWAVYGLSSKVLMSVGILCEVDKLTGNVVDLSRAGNAMASMLAILVAVVIYAVLVVLLRAISREDLKLMPKGDKIAKLLRIS
jgi:stage V sporulation protein B